MQKGDQGEGGAAATAAADHGDEGADISNRRMAGRTCALSGCTKPPWPSVGRSTPHLTCGNLHHQLLMASRFSPGRLPHPHQEIIDRNSAGLCALLPCDRPPYPGHAWCSRGHYLLWLADFSASLRPDQICKLPGCTRHVFVDDNHLASEFCGSRHEQKFVILGALSQRHTQGALLAGEAHPQEACVSEPSNESECGSVHSLNSRIQSLERFAVSRIRPTNIRILEDFYEKHPWEVLEEGRNCWLIARLKFTRKGRRLITKGHYHWKQSGPQSKKSRHTEKYYTYLRRKGKGTEDVEEQDPGQSYTMKEYTVEDVKWYSLIELVKERPSTRGGNPCRGQPHLPPPQTTEFIHAGFQDIGASKMGDEISVESFYDQLSPLDVCS